MALLIGLGWAVGCIGPGRGGEETAPDKETTPGIPARYDPLESDRDRQVVPRAFPSDQPIEAGRGLADGADETAVGGDTLVGPDEAIDSLNNQAFRVQILTTKLYGEARAAQRVAEEIFDRPVYMDYEVPYFKIRVGGFAEREAAEEYQQRAKAAGYVNAWVVVVTVDVEEPPPLYDALEVEVQDSLDIEGGSEKDD